MVVACPGRPNDVTRSWHPKVEGVDAGRAVAGEPAILLSDEPTGTLDSTSVMAMMELVAELHRDVSTICMVTHDDRYAIFVERTVSLFDGKTVDETETIAS